MLGLPLVPGATLWMCGSNLNCLEVKSVDGLSTSNVNAEIRNEKQTLMEVVEETNTLTSSKVNILAYIREKMVKLLIKI